MNNKNIYLLPLCFLLLLGNALTAQIEVDFEASATDTCVPVQIQFNDLSTSSAGKINKWEWQIIEGEDPIKIQNPKVNFTDVEKYNITLTVWDDKGNSNTLTREEYIKIYPNPIAIYSTLDTFGCSPYPVQLTNNSKSGAGTIEKIIWDFKSKDGVIEGVETAMYVYNEAGTFKPTLTIFNSYGCKGFYKEPEIIVLSPPKAKFTVFGDTSNCEPYLEAQFLNQTSGDGPFTFIWNFGDDSDEVVIENGDPTEVIKHIYNGEGEFTVQLIAINTACGKSDTITKENLIQLGELKASFESEVDTICVGTRVEFTSTSSPNPEEKKLIWNMGDGIILKGKNIKHIYTIPGEYTIQLTAKLKSCTDSISKKVRVYDKPTANFEAEETFSCDTPFTTKFNNLSVGAVKYKWFFGDGNTSTLENPTHTYSNMGIYDVKLEAINIMGCVDVMEKKKYIHVINLEIDSIIVHKDKGKLAFKFEVKYSTLKSDKVVQFVWDFGDGNDTVTTVPFVKHVYKKEDKYTVKIKIITEHGCEVEQEIEIDTKDIGGGGAFEFDESEACASRPIQFTDLSKKADQWLWHFGDGNTSTEQNPSHLYTEPGVYTVVLEIWYEKDFMDSVVMENVITIKFGPIRGFSVVKNCEDPKTREFVPYLPNNADSTFWDFGDGDISDSVSPIHTYVDTGLYRVVQYVFSKTSACIDSAVVFVGIMDPKPNFSASDTIFCKGQKIKFTAIGLNKNQIKKYYWNFGNEKKGKDETASSIYNESGLYSVQLVIEDTAGCFDTIVKKEFLKVGGPDAIFKIPSLFGCAPYHLNIIDSSMAEPDSPIVKWIWNYGDNQTDTFLNSTTSLNHTYPISGEFGLSLTVVDTFGCAHNKKVKIETQKPKAIYKADALITCPGNSIYFTNNSESKGEANYTWVLDGNTISEDKQLEYFFNTPGTYSPILIVLDNLGCKDTYGDTVKVEVIEPKASFSMTPETASCPPATTKLTSNSKNGVKFLWDFGDGEISAEDSSLIHEYYQGEYKIELVVTSIGGCTDTVSKIFNVKDFVGTFAMDTTKGCAPLEISLTAADSNATKFNWDFGDGVVIGTDNHEIDYTYKNSGAFIPKLIVIGEEECDTGINPGIPVIVGLAKADFVMPSYDQCDSATLEFENKSKYYSNQKSIIWDFGNGKTSTENNPTISFNQSGDFKVKLMVESELGCVDIMVKDTSIRIEVMPDIELAGDTESCLGEEIKLKALPDLIDNLFYRWRVDGKPTGTKSFISINTDKPGTWNVKLLAENSLGCSDSVSKELIVYPLPNVVVTPEDTLICENAIVSIEAQGGTKVKWSPEARVACSSCLKTVAETNINQWFYADVYNKYGCHNRDSLFIEVKQAPKLILNEDGNICLGDQYQINSSGVNKVVWSPIDGLSSSTKNNPVASPIKTTKYRAIGYAENNVCPPDTGFVTVSVNPYPKLTIPYSLELYHNEETQIKVQSDEPILTWAWEPSEGLSCNNCPDPWVKLTEGVNYELSVTTKHGCNVKEKLPVTVICDGSGVYVANAFTPNNDLLNDNFYISARGIETAKFIRIYNRWGQLIYEDKNVPLNQPSAGWDGTLKGEPCKSGVYVYEALLECPGGDKIRLKNSIVLIR